MTEEEKKEYDEIMAGLKGSEEKPCHTEDEENEEEEILMDRFTFGDKEPTILLAFEAIINRSECCEIRDGSLYVETEEAFDYVAKKLDLTHQQVLALALTVNFCSDQRIEMVDYCRHLHCSAFHFLPYMKDLDMLAERGFIICNRSNSRPTFRIPYYVLEALNSNRNIDNNDIKELDCNELFGHFDDIFEMLGNQEMTLQGATKKIQSLMESNPTLAFCQFVNTFRLNNNDLMLLVYFAHAFANNHDDRINLMELRTIFKDRHILKTICNELSMGSHKPISLKRSVGIGLTVNGNDMDLDIELPYDDMATLVYIYDQAVKGPLRGLDEDGLNEQFFPWLQEPHPILANVIIDATENALVDCIALGDPEETDYYREIIYHIEPCSMDDWWSLADGNDIKYYLGGFPGRVD